MIARELGEKIQEDIRIMVIEETANSIHIILPNLLDNFDVINPLSFDMNVNLAVIANSRPPDTSTGITGQCNKTDCLYTCKGSRCGTGD